MGDELVLICKGEFKKEYQKAKTESESDVRTYIFKDKKVVDGFIYQPSHSNCEFNEHKIICEDGVETGSNYLEIDRKTGKIIEVARVLAIEGFGFTYSFKGYCKKSDGNLF